MLKSFFIIWAIATLLVLIGAIPYAIWLGVLAWRRQWRKVRVRAVIPFAAYGLLSAATFFAGYWEQKHYFDTIFDAKVGLGTPLFEYESERAFNGDGYSVAVYELPAAVRERFEKADARLLSKFPEMPSERSRWATESWRKTPLEPRFEKQMAFALSSFNSREKPELSEHQSAIRAALEGPSAYYSFFWYRHGDYVGNIDFFVVDLAGSRVYVINSNT